MESEKNNSAIKKFFNGFLTLTVLRDVIIILCLVLLFWKLLFAQFNINLTDFKFSDLISLIMAIFAVSLSVAFYFKATDTSNMFYDNVYKFTKEVSEILGRIEAGFGERLRHIDEGYTGLRDKFDTYDLPNAKKKEVEGEKEVEQKEVALKKIINDLIARANLANNEKKELLSRLETAQKELENSKLELNVLKNNRMEAETIEIDPEFFNEFEKLLINGIPGPASKYSDSELNRIVFRLIRSGQLSSKYRRFMKDNYLMTQNNALTEQGQFIIRKIISSQ